MHMNTLYRASIEAPAHASVELIARTDARRQVLRPRAPAPPQAAPVTTEPEEEDFDETMRRAIQESIESNRTPPATDENESGMDVDAPRNPAFVPQQPWAGPGHERVYDDDDAELQAALRASLETMPPEFRIPDTPPPAAPVAPPVPAPTAAQRPVEPVEVEADQPSTPGAETDTETEGEGEAVQEEEAVSMEEMRRRRLARFGGP
ncbi:hypothetical protein EWM64_g7663 [Hericium alpestre]|uniref:Uncharacterized protein n=1 Tax=Hericium alpestre TaxID=135208 RepID=A0A4Y9ZQ26_9AGAM|nr:hypothetical protein EWM64_g7663 [Hericium alpestre]